MNIREERHIPHRSISVVIVDDHPLFRDGLSKAIELEDDIRVVAQCADGEEALRLAAKHPGDVVAVSIGGKEVHEQLRHAHPQSIRDFVANHAGSADLKLRTCVRCDSDVIYLAKEIIAAEPARAPKDLDPRAGAGPGLVEIISFPNQFAEAQGIAELARKFVAAGVPYEQILVLLRSDHQGQMSEVLYDAFNAVLVPSVTGTELTPAALR